MSPPAVEVRSPEISPPECSSATLQNPQLKPDQFDSSFSFPPFCPGDLLGDQLRVSSFSSSDPSGLDLKSTSNSQRAARSRPRLTKVRKRVQHTRSKVGSSVVSSNDEVVFLGDSSNFDSGFVFGANRNDDDSNSGDRVFTKNVHKQFDSGKVENDVFVFGAKLSKEASNSETSYNKCEDSSVNYENLVAEDGVKMKSEWKWENFMNAEKLDSDGGRMKVDSVTTDAVNNNVETVSVADTIDLASTVNADEGELDKSVGKAGTDSCSNLKTGNNDFLNNLGSSVSDFGVKMKSESIPEFQKAEASNVNFGRDVFVFGSSSLNEVTKRRRQKGRSKTPFTLPDEMKNLNINDSGNISGCEKPECSKAAFAEASFSSNDCDKPPGSSNRCPGNTNSHSSEGLAGSTGKTLEDNPESSDKCKTELQSGCEFSSAFASCSSTEPFNFLSGCFVRSDECQFPQPCVNDTLHVQKDPTTSSVSFQCQSNDNPHVVHLDEVGKHDENGPLDTSINLSTSSEFKIPQWDPSSFKENLFSDLNRISVSSIKSKLNKTKKKKTRGNLRQTKWQDKESKDDDNSQINLDSPGSCTPMDFSPYQETISVDQYSRDMPGESSHVVNSSTPWTTNSINENDVPSTGRKVTDAHNGIWKCSEPSEGSFRHHRDGVSLNSNEGFDSRNETVCSSPKTEQCCSCSSGVAGGVSREHTAGFNFVSDTLESNCRKKIDSEDACRKSFTFSASAVMGASLSATKSRHGKKNNKKFNHNAFVISPSPDMKLGPSFEFSSIASSSLHSEASCKLEAEEKLKQGHSFSAAIQETCEKWRLRYFSRQINFIVVFLTDFSPFYLYN